jgi:hypothetical protein
MTYLNDFVFWGHISDPEGDISDLQGHIEVITCYLRLFRDLETAYINRKHQIFEFDTPHDISE